MKIYHHLKGCFFIIFVFSLFLFSCSESHNRIKNYQISLTRNVTQINRDLQLYLNIIQEVAQTTEHLYNNQDDYSNDLLSNRYIALPNGVLLSRVEEGRSVVFVSGFVPITEEIKRIVYFTESIEDIFIDFVDSTPEIIQIYFTEKHSYIRIYPPFDVLQTYRAGIDFTNFNYYYLANESFNPLRNPLFIEDPHFEQYENSWVASAIAPVYHFDEMSGVVGVNINVNMLFDKWVIDTDSEEIAAFFMTKDGFWVAGDKESKSLLGLSTDFEQYYEVFEAHNIAYHNDTNIQNIARRLISGNKNFVASINDKMYYVLCADITPLSWFLVYILQN